jgi:glycosyltransferase involved in cell wall biosynthesis
MRILIAADIYPPEIGGPAEYAKNLESVWRAQGHQVSVKIFSRFNRYPWGIRHLLFLFSSISAAIRADFIVALGIFSGGVMTIIAKFFRKKIAFRTGGDLLWESYVERTGELVLLREFYKTKKPKFSTKEKLIFSLTRWMLRNLSAIIWSTEWQKNIFMEPYGLQGQKHFIVENYYGEKLPSIQPENKKFAAATRKLKWKNLEKLQEVFAQIPALLDTETVPHEEFLDKISRSYAIIIASLGDISPNTILDAIRLNKPFILTRENGLTPRIKEIGLFVDPEDESDIKEKVLWLLEPQNYERQAAKIADFNFTHSWEEMAGEYLDIYNKLK